MRFEVAVARQAAHELLRAARERPRLRLAIVVAFPQRGLPLLLPVLGPRVDQPQRGLLLLPVRGMSPSTKAKAYQWAAAIAGEIDQKSGWGPEDLIGGECLVVLEAAEDTQG